MEQNVFTKSTADEQSLVIPNDIDARVSLLFDEGKMIIKDYSLKCKLDSKTGELQKEGLNADVTRKLVEIVKAFANFEGLNGGIAKKTNLKRVLQVIANCTKDNLRFSFPDEVVTIAQEAVEKYEREGWGENADTKLINDEDTTPTSPTNRPSQQPSSKKQGHYVRVPPRNHPIYGENGIMRGIIVDRSVKMVSYRLGKFIQFPDYSHLACSRANVDNRFPRRYPKFVGHNGLTVGQCKYLQRSNIIKHVLQANTSLSRLNEELAV